MFNSRADVVPTPDSANHVGDLIRIVFEKLVPHPPSGPYFWFINSLHPPDGINGFFFLVYIFPDVDI